SASTPPTAISSSATPPPPAKPSPAATAPPPSSSPSAFATAPPPHEHSDVERRIRRRGRVAHGSVFLQHAVLDPQRPGVDLDPFGELAVHDELVHDLGAALLEVALAEGVEVALELGAGGL